MLVDFTVKKSVFLAIPRESFTSITSVVPGLPVMETQISPWCVWDGTFAPTASSLHTLNLYTLLKTSRPNSRITTVGC